MGDDASQDEMLLAVALGSSRRGGERRMLPDRRSGVDRRKHRVDVQHERRSNAERRQVARRKVDREEGTTLLQKARTRLTWGSRQRSDAEEPGDGLR